MMSLILGGNRSPAESIPVSDPYHISERQAVYTTWKKSFDEVASKANDPLLNQVKLYLDQGVALAAPRADGTIVVEVAQETDVFIVLVLLPSDAALSPEWAERYNNTYQGGAASFMPEQNLMVLRAEPIAPLVQGLLLGHEAFHALAAASRQSQVQTDEEYCQEEALAHRMELEVLRVLAPKFASLVMAEGAKVKSALQGQGGRPIDIQIASNQEMLETSFGPGLSEIDTNYRFTMLSLGAIFIGLYGIHNDEEKAMNHLAAYLCGEYKARGIR